MLKTSQCNRKFRHPRTRYEMGSAGCFFFGGGLLVGAACLRWGLVVGAAYLRWLYYVLAVESAGWGGLLEVCLS